VHCIETVLYSLIIFSDFFISFKQNGGPFSPQNLCPVFLTNLEGMVGKVGKVGKVGRVGKVGKVGKEGKEGRLRD